MGGYGLLEIFGGPLKADELIFVELRQNNSAFICDEPDLSPKRVDQAGVLLQIRCRQRLRKRLQEMKRLHMTLAWLAYFLGAGCQGQETYWLVQVAAPVKPPAKFHPYLENPANRTGDVAAITVSSEKIVFNGEWCDYQIEKIKPFKMDRLLADLIDDMGGRKSLDAFLSNKLKTAIVDWKDELTIKQSTKQIDESPCKLLQGSSIYRGKNELVLWDTTYFYRFKLGADFKY